MSAPLLSLAAIRQPAFLYDADGTVADANDLAEALAGRSLAGSTLAAVVGILNARSPDGTPLSAAEMPVSRVLAGEEAVDVPLVVTAADGRTVHVLAMASSIRDGGETVGALVIWQDVSALETAVAGQAGLLSELAVQGEELRTQNEELMAIEEELRQSNAELLAAQQRLRESDERFHSVLDNTRDALVRTNLQTGRYEYVSPSVEALVGYSPDAFSSMDNATALAMIHPDDLPVLLAAMARSEETGAAEAEYRQRTRSGAFIWVSDRMSVGIIDRFEFVHIDVIEYQFFTLIQRVHHFTQPMGSAHRCLTYPKWWAFCDLSGRIWRTGWPGL
jgi:PAS domain S-box-containing protein